VIDPIDRDILSILEREARTSFKDLAERVGLSANAVAERVRKLHDQGVIAGFKAEVDPSAFGLTLRALIEVKLEASTTAARFEAQAARTPGVVRALVTTGKYDVLLEVIARDQADLQRIIEELRAGGLTRDTYSRVIASDLRFPLTPPSPEGGRRRPAPLSAIIHH
jgi:Lrp/AsnC family transcriptional regulator, leucine-responsive regulatory protein